MGLGCEHFQHCSQDTEHIVMMVSTIFLSHSDECVILMLLATNGVDNQIPAVYFSVCAYPCILLHHCILLCYYHNPVISRTVMFNMSYIDGYTRII